MEKILSQDEVDALLKGVVSGEVDTEPKEEKPAGIRSYDLINQERIFRGRMPTLEMISDRFARLQAVSWGTTLRKMIDFSIIGTQVIKFSEFLKKIPVPSSLTVFQMDPLRGYGLFVMDAMVVYLVVDYFFGGSGVSHVKPEGRDFTPVQQRIIRTVATQALRDLEKAWQPVVPVQVTLSRSESNPQFAMIVSLSEIVVAITLRVHLGETGRDLFLAYPYSMLEPIKEKLYSGFFSDRMEQNLGWTARFKEELQDCAVEATVRFGTATVRVRDVLQFAPGDVIVLDQSPGDPLTCFVEGHPKFLGSAGVMRGSQVFRVSRALK
ncbi:flagellar motor switch protein FliM [Nitrospira sp. Kam-Ns4a]